MEVMGGRNGAEGCTPTYFSIDIEVKTYNIY